MHFHGIVCYDTRKYRHTTDMLPPGNSIHSRFGHIAKAINSTVTRHHNSQNKVKVDATGILMRQGNLPPAK
jgi:hypothetical protein